MTEELGRALLDALHKVSSATTGLLDALLVKRYDLGRRCEFAVEKKSVTQSVLFDRKKWTAARARAWLLRHDMKSGDMDTTENNLRFRQFPPSECSGGYQTLSENLPDGVKLIVCNRGS